MTKLTVLPLVLALTGCLTVTHAVATSKEPDKCIPKVIIGGDVALGAIGTYSGLLFDKPVLTGVGGVYLGLSTLLWFAQMGECGF